MKPPLSPELLQAAAEHLIAQAIHAGYRLEIRLESVAPVAQYRTRHTVALHPIAGPENRATAYRASNESHAVQHHLIDLRRPRKELTP